MIKIFIVTLSLSFITIPSIAQKKAITENGEEVILYDNATWKSADITPAYETRLDTLIVAKKADATFAVKSNKVKCSVWINPKKWSFTTKTFAPSQEYVFNLKNKQQEIMAVLIPERIQIPLSTFTTLALANMKEASPDAHLTREEVRIVNGVTVKMLQIEGTVDGLNFTYRGYYYSGKLGTVQLLAFTYKEFFDEFSSDIDELLSGFAISE